MAPADLAVITRKGQPLIFTLWHNRLFVTPEIVRRFRGSHAIYALISPSKDGAWLSALFASVGMGVVRGSSSKKGREAAGALVEALKDGCDVGITPDGPRGPVYILKPGAVVVARRSGALVVLVGMDYESAWRLSSWDGFYLPRPFSRMNMRFETVDIGSLQESEDTPGQLAKRLSELNPDRKPSPFKKRAKA